MDVDPPQLDHPQLEASSSSNPLDAPDLELEVVNVNVQGRPIRSNRGVLPIRFADFLPEGLAPLSLVEPAEENPPPSAPPVQPIGSNSDDINPWKITRTDPNIFGLIREFIGPLPLHDPDDSTTLQDLLAFHNESPASPPLELDAELPAFDSDPKEQIDNPFAPYPNQSSFLLDRWFWNHAQKSRADFDKLVEVLSNPAFILDDIKNINWVSLRRDTGSSSSPNFDNRAAWKKSSVQINIPVTESPFIVGNVFHKSLVDVVRAQFESFRSKSYHYVPHRLLWSPKPADPSVPPMEVFGELYNSRAFINAHLMLQASPPEPGCTLPRNIAAVMLSSDATHLAAFGTAQLWPFYIQFGNQSKYARGKPSERTFTHLAYIPKVCGILSPLLFLITNALIASGNSRKCHSSSNGKGSDETASHTLQARVDTCYLDITTQ